MNFSAIFFSKNLKAISFKTFLAMPYGIKNFLMKKVGQKCINFWCICDQKLFLLFFLFKFIPSWFQTGQFISQTIDFIFHLFPVIFQEFDFPISFVQSFFVFLRLNTISMHFFIHPFFSILIFAHSSCKSFHFQLKTGGFGSGLFTFRNCAS